MTRPDNEAPRILIVDDNRLDRELLRDALAGLAEIEDCENAEDALTALAAEPFDLILSDVVMPGLSGIELLEEVRRQHPGCDFVLVTGDASVESAVAALRMGASDYLQKPVRAEQLRRVVEQVILRRRLYEENRQLRDALHTVEACRALTPCLDPGEVYPVALDLLLGALSRQRGFALFHRTSVPNSDAVAFRGFDEREARFLRQQLIETKPVELEAVEGIERVDRGPLHESLRGARVEAGELLAIPVRGEEVEAGVIWILADGVPFGEDECELAGSIQKHATTALNNAERYHLAKERAFVDDVTEVYNARYLLSAAENEIRRAERYENPLSVLFLDLDRFKLVNDRHGHLVGSQTLRHLSQLLLECVRQVDTLARYGGDEFTILLVDTEHEAALAVAERIRRTVAEQLFEVGGEASLRLTISVGVATYPEHGESRDVLLDAADKAMYRAKSLGRDRVCSATGLDDEPGAAG